MKIESLVIDNVRNHKHNKINLSPKVNWFTGLSGGGKSTILGAIEMCSTGVNEWTNDAGTGSETQVGPYGSKGSVEMVLADKSKIKKAIPSPKDKSARYERDVVKFCLRCRSIFGMDSKEQKDLFVSLIMGELGKDVIFEMLNRKDISPEIEKLGDWLKQYANDEGVDYSENAVDKLYALCDKKRAHYRKFIKELDKIVIPNDIGDGIDVQPEVIAQWRSEVDKKNEEIWKIQNSSASDKAQYEAKKMAYDNAIKEMSRLKGDIEELKKELDATGDTSVEAESKVNGEHLAISNAINSLNTKINACQREVDKITNTDECAPGTCAKKSLKILNAEIAKNTRAKEELAPKLSSLAASIKDVSDRRSQKGKITFKMDKLIKELSALEGAKIVEPEALTDGKNTKSLLAGLNGERDKAKARLAELETQKYNFDMRQKIAGQIAEQDKVKADTNELLKRLEFLVPALSPNGIMTTILSDKLGELADRFNGELEYFDMAVKFVLEPWGTFVKRPGHQEFVIDKQLSWSEKSRYSAPVQVAEAIHSGFGVVGIDEHGLDISVRPAMLRYLLSRDVQSIVMSTLAVFDDQGKVIKPNPIGIDGVKVFFVENGVVEDIG